MSNALRLLALAMLVGVLGAAGCTKDARRATLHASLVAVNAARDGFAAYDHDRQLAIVDQATSLEDGRAKLAAYRDQRLATVHRFELAYRALALAATQTDDPSLKAAIAQAADLVQTITQLTTKPGGP